MSPSSKTAVSGDDTPSASNLQPTFKAVVYGAPISPKTPVALDGDQVFNGVVVQRVCKWIIHALSPKHWSCSTVFVRKVINTNAV